MSLYESYIVRTINTVNGNNANKVEYLLLDIFNQSFLDRHGGGRLKSRKDFNLKVRWDHDVNWHTNLANSFPKRKLKNAFNNEK